MQVGFAVVIKDGQVAFQFLGRRPEDPRSLVSHARHGRQHAVLMGRLTYRSELARRLPPEFVPSDLEDDAALALAGYRCWGPEGLTRLEGSYAVVVWDGDNRRLVGSRDPFGGYPLFWTGQPGALGCGTCLPPLVRLAPRPSLNLEYLAEFLALPAGVVVEPRTRHCVYEGLYRVGPGSIIEADSSDGAVRERSYWDWTAGQSHYPAERFFAGPLPGTSEQAKDSSRSRPLQEEDPWASTRKRPHPSLATLTPWRTRASSAAAPPTR